LARIGFAVFLDEDGLNDLRIILIPITTLVNIVRRPNQSDTILKRVHLINLPHPLFDFNLIGVDEKASML